MTKTIATFKVTDSTGDLIKMYSLTVMNADELKKLIQEARQVWDEYYVEVETDLFTQSFSHTYSEEVLTSN
jgi:hypothetical protein